LTARTNDAQANRVHNYELSKRKKCFFQDLCIEFIMTKQDNKKYQAKQVINPENKKVLVRIALPKINWTLVTSTIAGIAVHRIEFGHGSESL
jgi:hypothetical protein